LKPPPILLYNKYLNYQLIIFLTKKERGLTIKAIKRLNIENVNPVNIKFTKEAKKVEIKGVKKLKLIKIKNKKNKNNKPLIEFLKSFLDGITFIITLIVKYKRSQNFQFL
jgi:hypothetical protein